MKWYVYLLMCADNTLYCGITNDLVKRIKKHNSGKGAKYTRARIPSKVVYFEIVNDKGSALRREIAIKKMKKLKKHELYKRIYV